MPQLFIPPLKAKIRLTAPLCFTRAEVLNQYNNIPQEHVLWQIMRPGEPWDYRKVQLITDFELEEGTVLEFKRYFLSTNARENRIDVNIWAHPRRDLTPKKQGGTSNTLTLELPVEVMNRIEYEDVIL